MNYQTYHEIVEDLKMLDALPTILKTETPTGFITIERLPKHLLALDNDGIEVARTYEVNNKGLKWLKAQCRGWGGWIRLNWKEVIAP